MTRHVQRPELRGYAICTEQRSGSSYLCQILASTGVLGRPLEYFNGVGMAAFQPDYPQAGEDQLGEIVRQGATANGVYALKMFSEDFDRRAPRDWARRLPNLHFVHLTRRDLLGQAISATRLAQTNQYFSGASADGEAFYDSRRIAREIRRLAWGQARWSAFFARCGLAPLHLDYEDIVLQPQEAAGKVARLVGLEDPARVDLQQVQTRPQRDAVSDEWRRRFVGEAGDPIFLDKPLPPSFLERASGILEGRSRRKLAS